MTKHNEASVGLWTVGDSPEDGWSGEAFFDTKEEAEAYARQEDRAYIGCVEQVADPEFAARCAMDQLFDDSDFSLDNTIRMQDEWGWCEDKIVNQPTKEMRAELEAFMADWFRRHKLVDRRWCVMDQERVGPEEEES